MDKVNSVSPCKEGKEDHTGATWQQQAIQQAQITYQLGVT